jgi:hypothetical protein
MSMRERRALQGMVAVLTLVPLSAGLAGVVLGPGFVGGTGGPDLDSHFRYLSGIFLGVGLVFAGCVRRICAPGASASPPASWWPGASPAPCRWRRSGRRPRRT